ncbi:alpha/beta fold hydrolase [Georgenia alba]|uniref:Alpha/beta fold hydrolase n=1 Tax=Georgenia alba TaxID=2233858 RepID=A0ABW2QCR1_9MICO
MSGAVVLVHGIRGASTIWRQQMAALGRAGIPALAPDLPGHGTRRGTDFTVDAAMEVIDRAAEELSDHGPVLVAGISLGGYLTLHWAARPSSRPAGVLAASCCTQPRGVGLALYRRTAEVIARLPDGGARLSDTLSRRLLPPEGYVDLTAGGVAVEVMVPGLTAMAGVDTERDIRAIGVPVWFVNGSRDHFRIHERRFLRAARDGRLVLIPRATHLVSLTHPVAFNRALLDIAGSLSRSAATMVR